MTQVVESSIDELIGRLDEELPEVPKGVRVGRIQNTLVFRSNRGIEYVAPKNTEVILYRWGRIPESKPVIVAMWQLTRARTQVSVMSDGSVKTKDLKKITTRFSGGRSGSRSASD